jgi:hypothetical protein
MCAGAMVDAKARRASIGGGASAAAGRPLPPGDRSDGAARRRADYACLREVARGSCADATAASARRARAVSKRPTLRCTIRRRRSVTSSAVRGSFEQGGGMPATCTRKPASRPVAATAPSTDGPLEDLVRRALTERMRRRLRLNEGDASGGYTERPQCSRAGRGQERR